MELKSHPDKYGISQPEPEEFADLVMQVLQEKKISGVYNVQSFDVNILKVFREKYPEVKLAYLVSDGGIEKNLDKLGFVPAIYSPHYKLVKSAVFVDSIRSKKMQLIPWTVNEQDDIQRMLELQVDTIITDHPEQVLALRR